MSFKWVRWPWLNWERWSHSNCNYNCWGYGFNRVYLFHRWTPFLIGYVHMLPTCPEREEGYKVRDAEVLENCRKYGMQDCHTCPDLECCDNTNYPRQLRHQKDINVELERELGSEQRLSNNRRFHLAESEKELLVLREHIRVLDDANKVLWEVIDWVFHFSGIFNKEEADAQGRCNVIHNRLYDMLREKERADDESRSECGIETKTRP